MDARELIAGARVFPKEEWSLSGTILVTGACGSIGSLLYDTLHNAGAKVTGLDWNEGAVVAAARAGKNMVLGDYGHHTFGHDYDLVFHAAAYKHVISGELWERAMTWNNYHSFKMWLDYHKRVVLVSTDKAAGKTTMGASKKMAEDMADYKGHTSIRLVNVWGSRGSVGDLWTRAVERLQKPKCCPRGVSRYWMSGEDAIQAILAASCMRPGRYTVCNVPKFTMGEMLDAFLEHHQKALDWFEPIPLPDYEAPEEALISESEKLEDTVTPYIKRII